MGGKKESQKEEIEKIVENYLRNKVKLEINVFSVRTLYLGIFSALLGFMVGIAAGIELALSFLHI